MTEIDIIIDTLRQLVDHQNHYPDSLIKRFFEITTNVKLIDQLLHLLSESPVYAADHNFQLFKGYDEYYLIFQGDFFGSFKSEWLATQFINKTKLSIST